ncbi:MAG TPA: nuclear transport factor 2 family protein [Chitinophagaceae bacterium]|nr:nuclear transport factor 2 family protein [Chitinophagaceae bacterium]
MRLIVLLAVVSIFFAACSTNQEKAGDFLTEAEVKEFIRGYDEMWASRDTGLMKQAMDDHYIYFTSTGSTRGRSDIIGWFTPADKYEVEKAKRSEISIQLKGNTGIVSSRWVGNGSFGNEKFNDDQRCSLIIQKTDGKLKLLAEHCTQIAGANNSE